MLTTLSWQADRLERLLSCPGLSANTTTPASRRLVRTSRPASRLEYDSSPPPILLGRTGSDSGWPIFWRAGWVTWTPPGASIPGLLGHLGSRAVRRMARLWAGRLQRVRRRSAPVVRASSGCCVESRPGSPTVVSPPCSYGYNAYGPRLGLPPYLPLWTDDSPRRTAGACSLQFLASPAVHGDVTK